MPYTPSAAAMPYSPAAMNPPPPAAWQVPGLGLGLALDSAKVLGMGPPQPMFSPIVVAGPPPAFDVSVYSPPPPLSLAVPPPVPVPAPAPNYTYSYTYGSRHGTDEGEPAAVAQRPPSLSVSAAPESEFPYVPPKSQRVGHARRVSVTIKSKESEDLDALGLDTSSHGRLPWQTHALDRVARRVSVFFFFAFVFRSLLCANGCDCDLQSWAPSSSSALHAAEPTPTPVLYGM